MHFKLVDGEIIKNTFQAIKSNELIYCLYEYDAFGNTMPLGTQPAAKKRYRIDSVTRDNSMMGLQGSIT